MSIINALKNVGNMFSKEIHKEKGTNNAEQQNHKPDIASELAGKIAVGTALATGGVSAAMVGLVIEKTAQAVENQKIEEQPKPQKVEEPEKKEEPKKERLTIIDAHMNVFDGLSRLFNKGVDFFADLFGL